MRRPARLWRVSDARKAGCRERNAGTALLQAQVARIHVLQRAHEAEFCTEGMVRSPRAVHSTWRSDSLRARRYNQTSPPAMLKQARHGHR